MLCQVTSSTALANAKHFEISESLYYSNLNILVINFILAFQMGWYLNFLVKLSICKGTLLCFYCNMTLLLV